MRVLAASVFSTVILAVSEMVPGFAFEGKEEQMLFYMVAWLCGYELFQKSEK